MLETIIIGGLIITAVNKTKNRKTGKDKRDSMTDKNRSTPVSDALAWAARQDIEGKTMDALGKATSLGKRAAASVTQAVSGAATEVKSRHAEYKFGKTLDELNRATGGVTKRTSETVASAEKAASEPLWVDGGYSTEFMDDTIKDTLADMRYNPHHWETRTGGDSTLADILKDAEERSAKKYLAHLKETSVFKGSRDFITTIGSRFQEATEGLGVPISDLKAKEATSAPNRTVSQDVANLLASVDSEDEPQPETSAVTTEEDSESPKIPSEEISGLLDLTGEDEKDVSLENALDILQARAASSDLGAPVLILGGMGSKINLDALARQAVAKGLKAVKLSTSNRHLSDGSTPRERTRERINLIVESGNADGVDIVFVDARTGSIDPLSDVKGVALVVAEPEDEVLAFMLRRRLSEGRYLEIRQ
jgi:hypothetical protein